jgi:redox-sensitive bicupin YhaK (pirin superfamily)
MVEVRRSEERGYNDLGWLRSHHTFSFGGYYDPQHEQFRTLRVINDDWIAPGKGFGTHPHRDMEIITYVLEGAVAHQDSTGGRGVIRRGEVQRMTAGRGIAHSEFNASETEPLHLLQIWLFPERPGLDPGYEQKAFPDDAKRDQLRLVAAPDGRDGALTIHQDAELYATVLEPGQTVTHALRPGRHAWVQVAAGEVTLNGESLREGDGAALSDEAEVTLRGDTAAEILLFDLA